MDIDVQVHPVAALFPMLAEDELRELAEDIRQRGLLQPIVLAPDGSILDGRNRYAACQLAGVEPQYVTYEGNDPDGYALAVNIARRHLSKGQKAMVLARASMVSEKPIREIAANHDMTHTRISYARMVIEYASDLAPQVLSGTLPLNDAYATAQERKREAEEQKRQRERLQRQATDLLSLVDEERMSLADAIAALKSREAAERERQQREQAAEHAQRQEERRQRQVATELIVGPVNALAGLAEVDTGELFDPELAAQPVTRRKLALARRAIERLEEIWERRGMA